MLLNQFLHPFEEHLVRTNKSTATMRSYMASCQQFLSYIQSLYNYPVTIDKITEENIQAFLLHLKIERGYKPASLNVKLNGIRNYFQYAIRKDIITKDPSHYVESAREDRERKDFLTQQEIQQLLAKIEHSIVQLVVRTLANTGLRISECIALTFDDIDFDENKIYVRNGKGNKSRTIPLSVTLKPYLLAYKNSARKFVEDGEYFFATSKTGAISAVYINRLIHEAVKQLKWTKHVTCHTLRHSFASNLVKNGVNLPTVAALLGHADFRTVTSVYVHIEDESLQEAVDALAL